MGHLGNVKIQTIVFHNKQTKSMPKIQLFAANNN